jgi:V/A-type H+-transporting ATPase subunit I
MRIDVQKWLFVMPNKQKDAFFSHAQELGLIEFIHPTIKAHNPSDDTQNQIMQALHLLREISVDPDKPFISKQNKNLIVDPAYWHQKASKCIETYDLIEKIKSSLITLNQDLERIEVLGDFSLSRLAHLERSTALKYAFVFCKTAKDVVSQERMFKLGSSEGLDYYLWLSAGEELNQSFTKMIVDYDPEQLRRLIHLETQQIEALHHKMIEFKTYEKNFKSQLISLLNQQALDHAKSMSQTNLEGYLLHVLGWVPSSKLDEMHQLAHAYQTVALQVGLDENELIPTYLENSSTSKLGQDLISIYDTPSNDDKDPSTWVLIFFTLFFAMIIDDAGYGLIFLAASFLAHIRFKHLEGLAARMKKLSFILSSSCIIWGLLTNAFFGINFEPSHPIRQVSLIHALSKAKVSYHWYQQDETYQAQVQVIPSLKNLSPQDPQTILEQGYIQTDQGRDYRLISQFSDAILKEIALLVGVVHLFLSLARYMRRNWAALGWMIFLVGGWLYFPKVLQATTFVNYLLYIPPAVCIEVGFSLMVVGIAWSLIISVIQNGLSGLLEFMNLIQVFSDALSYLRLYALGLAGGIMSSVFNQLAASSGLVLGAVIIVIGHSVNITLGIMSGVIHGLRLNFLEWYHYSFLGGGRWLRPLRKIDRK